MRNDRGIKRVLVMGLVFIAGYAGIVFTEVGGDRFFDFHTSWLPFLFAFIAWLEILALIGQSSGTTAERVWRYFAAGIAFWMLAEGLWLYYEFWQGVELPYPSWSDVFWALGYLPIVIGMWWQYRTLEVSVSMPRRAGLAVFLAVLVVVIGFGLYPLGNQLDLATVGEFLLGVVYLLLDIALLSVLFLLVSALTGGVLAAAWRWVASGFALLAISDAFFFMLTWHGQYYPGGEANFLSLLTDYIYVIAYAVLVMGLYIYRRLSLQSHRISPAALAQDETGPLHVQNRIVVFTDGKNRIISASPTLAALLELESVAEVEGRPLCEVLPGLERLERRLLQEQFVSEMLVTLQTPRGAPIPARVSGLGMYEGERWQGANILIGLLVSLGVDDAMNDEFRSMADYIASRTGTLQQEHRAVAGEYLNQTLAAFRAAVEQSKGPAVAASFYQHVLSAMREAGFPVEDQEGRLALSDRLSNEDYRLGIARAVEIALGRAVDLLGRGGAHAVLRQVNEAVHGRAREILLQQGLLSD